MTSLFVSGTDRPAQEYRRVLYDDDPTTFPAAGYRAKGYDGIAWTVLGWECEGDEDTEWSGYVNPTDNVLALMKGDDRVFSFDADDLSPLERKDYCGECGQIGCTHDGLDREEASA